MRQQGGGQDAGLERGQFAGRHGAGGQDVRAAAALGIAPPVHLPFREAPHRGYGAPPELFSETRADDGIAGDLAPALSASLP